MGESQLKATAHIFLSYAREDEEKVEQLYQKLSGVGFRPWMDKKDILPGERWESCIQKAIQCSDSFLACLSANSVDKMGFIQKEIKDALDMWREKSEDDIYLIPVRLEDCEIPESLCEFQWVNLFEEGGWTRLVKAIQVGIERRAEVSADEEPPLPQSWEHRRRVLKRYELLYYRKAGVEEIDRGMERARRNFEETANAFSVSVSQLQDALAILVDRHRVVLELRYGLLWPGKKRTYEEVTQEFPVPVWRIKQLEEEGLFKLRQVLFNQEKKE